MKYLLKPLAFLLCTLYLIAERTAKAIICAIIFLWNFSLNEKYYSFYKGVIFYSVANIEKFESVNMFYKEMTKRF